MDDIVVKLQKNNDNVNRMKVRSERLNKKFGDSTRISTLQKIKDETKKYMNEAEKYMNKAEKYRDEITKSDKYI